MFVVQEFFQHIGFFTSDIGTNMVSLVSTVVVVILVVVVMVSLSSSLYTDCCFVCDARVHPEYSVHRQRHRHKHGQSVALTAGGCGGGGGDDGVVFVVVRRVLSCL